VLNVYKSKENDQMSLTSSERQRKHREKMKAKSYTLVRVWVPKDTVDEIKSLAERLIREAEIKTKK
jgi:hypothetical protein